MSYKLNMELDIASTRMMQNLILHNEDIEKQIEKGIQLAISDVLNEDTLINNVRATTREAIFKIANKAVLSYEVRQHIETTIQDTIKDRLNDLSKEIGSNIYKELGKYGANNTES